MLPIIDWVKFIYLLGQSDSMSSQIHPEGPLVGIHHDLLAT